MRKNCAKCHDANTYLLPLTRTALPMTVTQKGQVVSVTQPVTAVCASCHDSAAAKRHFAIMTTADKVETCNVCHSEGRESAVSKVHK